MTSLLDNLDVFYGELTPARATVYARLGGLENTDELSLSGFVRGPRCFYSTTLPATFRLQDAGPGPSLLSKSLVPDPSYWSPETPHIYDVTVELRNGSDIISSETRQIGFKPLGISGRFFTWEGKPWVLRGIGNQSTTERDVAVWREQSVVLDQHPFTDAELRHASEYGVLCFSSLPMIESCREADVLDSVRRLAKYPSVAFVWNQWNFRRKLQQAAPNVLLVEPPPSSGRRHVTYGADPSQLLMYGATLPFDSSAVLMEPYLTNFYGEDPTQPHYEVPTIAYRPIRQPKKFVKSRAACDKLQADLAPFRQFAGYLV